MIFNTLSLYYPNYVKVVTLWKSKGLRSEKNKPPDISLAPEVIWYNDYRLCLNFEKSIL